jgi:hypothetical protein
VGPLLALLEAAAASSSTAAEAIVRCKGMPEALLALLDLPFGINSVTNSVSNTAGSTAGSAASQQQQLQHKGSDSRVAVLRLLRLLCASSPLACQLLRTAGLDTAVQTLLCSSSSSGLVSQLMLLEALRFWMVSALHGVCLAHMDVMFQFLAALLQPPSPAAAAAAAADPGPATNSSSSSSEDETTLRWQLTAAAYQLLDVLLRHALAVQGGAKTLGSQMISPGCAAAIAQEAAANWLNPAVLFQVGQALVSLSDCQLPYELDPNSRAQGLGSGSGAAGFSSAEAAAGQAAWLRVLAGLHPALLVPRAAAVLAGLSSMLGYLGSYWRSLQVVPRQLAAELLTQLQAAGLTGSSSSSSSSNSSGSRQEDSMSNLAHVLLTMQSSGGTVKQQQELGAALLQHCLQLLAAAGGAAGTDAPAMSSSSSSRLLATHALASAASGTLLAVCELQQQLQQLSQPPPQQQQQQQQEQVLGLAAAVAEVVASNALRWVSAASPSQTLALEPWRLAQLNMRQYQLQLLIKLAKPSLAALQQQQQQQRLSWQLVDGLLCVLPLSAPGQEAQALQALQLLFGPEAAAAAAAAAGQSGTVTFARDVSVAAQAALQQLQQQGGPLAAAAAGVRSDKLPATADSYPYHPALLAAAAAAVTGADGGTATAAVGGMNIEQWCHVLLEGYAVTWLSVVAQRDEQQQQGSGAVKTPVVALPLPRVYVSEVEGSRLPVPPEWIMLEILALPASGSSSSSSVSTLHPVSAALLLALGLEMTPPSCYMTTVSLPAKLEALLQLLYMFNAGELLGPAGQQQQQQVALAPAWQQGDARWAAAVLSQHYCSDIVQGQQAPTAAAAGGAGSSSSSGTEHVSMSEILRASCPVQEILTSHLQQQQRPSSSTDQAKQQQQQQQQLLLPTWSASSSGSQLVDRLVRDLAELSMGDPIFASHVALLLLPAAGSKLQRAVWGCLAEQSALHLLPPLDRCILGAAAYLGGSSSSCPRFDVQLVGDMAKSLAQGDLRKSLQMGGLAGQLALQGVAALCLDQQAWSDTARTSTAAASVAAGGSSSAAGGGGAKPVSAAGMAVNVLRGVLRACPLELLQQLVGVGVARGVAVADQGRALVQAAHGDAALMDKVQQLLSAVQ